MQPMLDYYSRIYEARWRSLVGEASEPSCLPASDLPESDDEEDEGEDVDDDAENERNPQHRTGIAPGGAVHDLGLRRKKPVSVPRCLDACCPPLSVLSYLIFQCAGVILLVLLGWSFLGPYYWDNVAHSRVAQQHNSFGPMDYLLLWATLGQAIILTAIFGRLANCRKHTELSFDAVTKYFASGFVLSVSLAVFYESIMSLVIRMLISLGVALAGVDQVQSNGFQSEASDLSIDMSSLWTFTFTTARIAASPFPPLTLALTETTATNSKEYFKAFGNSHPVFYTFYLLMNAFLLAAFVEELCKYFGYRMVDHPDFFSRRELQDLSRACQQSTTSQKARNLFEKQRQSVQSRGSAVTLAMVAVAMGFTCCENLVYIFVYSGSSPGEELAVLIARTLFPVHPLAAAIQSIGVIRRDIENPHEGSESLLKNWQLGRIILPAVIFHGGYDFFLLWIDYLAARNGVYTADNMDGANDGETDDASEDFHGEFAGSNTGTTWALVLSVVVSVAAMALALWYYLKESRLQRARLQEIDRQNLIASSTYHSRMS
jgi:RsiW-degrading membrane proteinase PrsW (M82 family)